MSERHPSFIDSVAVAAIDWRHLAARASFVSERLSDLRLAPVEGGERSRAEERAQLWALAAANGDRERLARRVEWSGYDASALESVLGEVALARPAELPEWTGVVRWWIEAIEAKGPSGEGEEGLGEGPFASVYAPLVSWARARVAAGAPEGWARLGPSARAGLTGALARRLDYLCQRCIYVAYSQSGRCGHPARPPGHEQARTSSTDHAQAWARNDRQSSRGLADFLAHMQSGGLREFVVEYPVLARFAATAAMLWVEASVELLERLVADWSTIEGELAGGRRLSAVTELAAQLSDPHAGGRSVAIVTFDDDVRAVYKPRGLAIDQAFDELVAALAAAVEAAGLPGLRTLTSIDRGTHGWVEFAEAQPCADADAATRLYTRAGMMICLVYVLGGLDCHHENLVACGEHLVFIDLETMLQPPARQLSGSPTDTQALIARRFSESVLRGGMLPCWEVLGEGEVAVDQSGLGGGRSHAGLAPRTRWRATGPDDVVLELHVPEAPVQLRYAPNVPVLDGEALEPADHVEAIVAGFVGMYRIIVAESSSLLAEGGALAGFADLELRYLLRPTRVYHLLLRDTLRPPLMRDGADFSIALEPLARALLGGDERPEAWTLLDAELAALERLDIPMFFARADRRSIAGPGGRHEAQELLPDSAIDHLRARVGELGEADLDEQVMIIRCALHRCAMTQSHGCHGACEVAPQVEVAGALAIPSRAELRAEAVALGDRLAERAVRGDDGGAAWMGVAFMRESGRVQLRPLDLSLDRGVTGVAVFLASLARQSGEARFAELARGALVPVRRLAREATPRTARLFGLGGSAGLGAMIYGLTCCAEALDDASLLDDAAALARLIEPELIAADRELDVVGGSAGAILGLLALHEARPDREVLARAEACAEHLLAQAEEEGAGLAWRSRGRPAQTGLSHGAAGFCLALGRLHAITPRPDLRAAIAGALAFERAAFVASEDNWRDLRPGAEHACAMSWCNGAPGIGLARAQLRGCIEDAQLEAELAAATRSTLAAPLAELDTPCCGNLGRVDLLLEAGEDEAARELVARVLARARARAGYGVLRDAPQGVLAPAFMSGIAGIGYQLLRVADPSLRPVLAWAR